jgi:hypothetical protein
MCIAAHTDTSIATEKIMPDISEVFLDVWSQVLVYDSKVVTLGSETFPVIRSKKKRFRQVYFVFNGMSITGLEQNPETKSNWAKMAREGIKVMQFIHDGKYIAVVAAGKVTLYGKRTGLTNKTKRLAD